MFETSLLGHWRISCFFFFHFPPLELEKKVTVEQGLLTGSLESQETWDKVKYGNLLLFKEKILMALNCLNISKSFAAWGEKKEKLPPSLHLLQPRRRLEI